MLSRASITDKNAAVANAASSKLQNTLLIVGLILLALWTTIWTISARQNYLVIAKCTFVPCLHYLGCDFDVNYYATRTWIAGGDPYQDYLRKGFGKLRYEILSTGLPEVRLDESISNGITHEKYSHPPVVLGLFSWCALLPRDTAAILWFVVQTTVFSLAVFLCQRSRNELALCRIPLPLLLAATLFSYPVLCEMQQGNWNMLVLLFLILTVWYLRGRSLACDFLCGAFGGIAAWIKVYPALILLGLLALRRWRAAGFLIVVALIIGLATSRGTLEFAENIAKETAVLTPDFIGSFSSWSHTVSGAWMLFCRNLHLKWLGHLPGTAGWGLLVFPLVMWVSYWVAKAPDPSRLLYPYFLWLVASATYLPPIANDYSLFFLPLAALALWDRRHSLFVHVLMAIMLIWWQPLWLPISARFLWYSKLISLGTVGIILVMRAWEEINVEYQGACGRYGISSLSMKAALSP